jgi:7,8-dihydropterin-6-yl-methyl-4-(beta-D-ribofuranosyl)aminobenzene 5'-phosphate synthase
MTMPSWLRAVLALAASVRHEDQDTAIRNLVVAAAALAVAASLCFAAPLNADDEFKRITILYDAFGPRSALVKDWGFAAFVEYGGRRILFDTGNDARIFEQNVKQLGVDLGRLDAAVISHRHGDHTSGLTHLLAVNPDVKIYAPLEAAFFGSVLPAGFLEPRPGLPGELRYYEGKPPERTASGTPWGKAKFAIVTKTTEIFPGFFVLTTRSQKPGTLEMNEVSLAVRTPRGLAVVVGCSHPGVERILEEAAKIDSRLFTVAGGFHLVLTPDEEIQRVASVLKDSLEVERVAPGHCTSEPGFAAFLARYKDRFDRAGLGAVIPLP